MKKLYILISLGCFIFNNGYASNTSLVFQSEESPSVQEMLFNMTLAQKVGQLLMVGVKDKHLTPETQKLVKDLKLGGVIFYSHNVTHPLQVKEFVLDLQQISRLEHQTPLFIAVDQEGGSVARIRKNTQILPSAMAIGATRSPQFAFMAGKMTALDLSAMGINMNLAPVLDINTNEENSVIGIRSFGESPELVSQLGMWYIEGLQSQGVVATAKHFPGHGDTIQDSHYTVPVLQKNLEDLEKFHLIPFRRAIENGLDAIMTAHISVPGLDPSGIPATFSYNLLTNIIRNRMNFEGVIITDDLEMKSIQNDYGIGEAALKAILAGADMVMVSWTKNKKYEVFKTLLEAVKTGKLSEQRLNQSVKRILKLKLKRGIFEPHRGPALAETLGNTLHKNLAQKIADHAVTVVTNEGGIFPLQEEDTRRVLLITPLDNFYRDFKFFYERTGLQLMPARPTLSQIESTVSEITQRKERYDLFIFGVTHPSH